MRYIIITLLSVSLVACGGRSPVLVSTSQPGDKALTCNQIEAHIIQQNDALISLTTEKSARNKRNIGMGIAGLFLIVPWFFLDLGDAPEQEEAAINRRNNTLKRYANEKNCDVVY